MPLHGFDTQLGSATLATVPIQLAPSSQYRQRIMISIDGGTGFVTTNNKPTAGKGWTITPQSPLDLCFDDHGDIVRAAWWGSADTNARTFTVIPVESGAS